MPTTTHSKTPSYAHWLVLACLYEVRKLGWHEVSATLVAKRTGADADDLMVLAGAEYLHAYFRDGGEECPAGMVARNVQHIALRLSSKGMRWIEQSPHQQVLERVVKPSRGVPLHQLVRTFEIYVLHVLDRQGLIEMRNTFDNELSRRSVEEAARGGWLGVSICATKRGRALVPYL